MKNIKTSTAKLQLDENGIVHMSFLHKNMPIKLKDSENIYKGRMTLTDGLQDQLLLVDLRNNPRPDIEARNYAKSKEVIDSTKAMAAIVGGALSKILGNFFIGFNKGSFPVKLFTNKEDAIIWLLKFTTIRK